MVDLARRGAGPRPAAASQAALGKTLVTIVTPSLNQGEFIRDTIESVLSQDYPALEYLIIDGGSTDQTPKIAAQYAGRLTFLSAPDRGQSHAINKGFRMARGTILAWLNSDDVYLPGAVTTAVNALTHNPQAAAVYGEGYLIDRAGQSRRRFPATAPLNRYRLTHVEDYILQQTVFIRRTAIDDIGYLDEDLHYVMDWDLLIRIAKRYPIAYVPEYLACLREYPEAKSARGGRARVAEIGRLMRRHTGRTMTPGYLIHALQTYKQTWVRHLPHGRLEWAATTAANLAIERIERFARRRALNEK